MPRSRDLPRACPGAETHRQQLLDPPHGQPLCRHPAPPSIAMAALEARSLLTHETILLRMPHPAGVGGIVRMLGGLRSERWAPSRQNRGRHQIGIGVRLALESAARARPLAGKLVYQRVMHGHFGALDSGFGTATLGRKPIVRIPIDSSDSCRCFPVNIGDRLAGEKHPLLHPAYPPPASRIKDASRCPSRHP